MNMATANPLVEPYYPQLGHLIAHTILLHVILIFTFFFMQKHIQITKNKQVKHGTIINPNQIHQFFSIPPTGHPLPSSFFKGPTKKKDLFLMIHCKELIAKAIFVRHLTLPILGCIFWTVHGFFLPTWMVDVFFMVDGGKKTKHIYIEYVYINIILFMHHIQYGSYRIFYIWFQTALLPFDSFSARRCSQKRNQNPGDLVVWKKVSTLRNASVLVVKFVGSTGVMMNYQPKQCTVCPGKSLKITIPLHQIWSPPIR